MAGSVWLEFSMRCRPMESVSEATGIIALYKHMLTTVRHTAYVGDLISIDLCPSQLPHWLLWSLAGLWPGIHHLLQSALHHSHEAV